MFPTIPTVADGRVLSSLNTSPSGTHTFPNLSNLTKSAGDLLVAICIIYDGNSANAEFSNWGASFTEFGDFATTTTVSIGCAYKRSTGSESGTFTVTSADTSTNDSVCILLAIPNVHASSAPEAGGYASGTLANANPGAFNPTNWDIEDTLWIAVGGVGETSTGGTWTGMGSGPSGWSDFYATGVTADAIGAVEGGIAFLQSAVASVDPPAFANDVSNTRWGACTIAIRPIVLTPVSATYAAPFEGIQRFSKTGALSFEAIQRLSSPYATNYEATERIGLKTFQTPYEALQGISYLPIFPWEAGAITLVTSDYVIPFESRGWTTADLALPYEAIQRTSATYSSSFEALTKFAQTTAAQYESFQKISSTYDVPEESQFALASQKELPYESLIQIGSTWINPWESRATVTYKQTGIARISLEPGSTPETRTYHYLAVRARVTNAAEVGTLRLRLYEGANPRSAELETAALSDSFQTYLLHVDDADAAAITSYSDLEVRMYGYSSTGDSADFEVAEIWLQIPTAGNFINVTFDAPYEALKILSATLTKPWESVLKLTAINAVDYEALEGIRITVEEPYESLLGLSITYDTHYESRWNTGSTWINPFEALEKISLVTGVPYDALGSFSFTQAIPWESMQINGVMATFELAYESIGAFSLLWEMSYESLLRGITKTHVVPYEALQGIQTLYGIPQDSTGIVQATAVFAYEALKLLQLVAETNYESIGRTTQTYEQPYEALQLFALQTGFPYESLVGLRSLTSVPWEGISISGVLTSFEIAYEALQALSSTTGVPYEALQKLSSATQAAYESLVGISSATAVPWEAAQITGLFADFILPFESIGWTSAPNVLPYEGLLYIPTSFTYPYEALRGIARTDETVYEALQAIAQSTGIPWEARGWITNDLTVPYEALQALSLATETPLEMLVGLSLTSAIPWESVSQLVGEHILRAIMFSHYYVQMMKVHEAHMFTHLATEPKQHLKAQLFKPTSYRPRRYR